MTIKEKLNKSLTSDALIESYLIAFIDIKKDLKKFGNMKYDILQENSLTCDNNSIEKLSNSLVDIEISIQEELIKILGYKKENLKLISTLDNDLYKTVLTLRYVSCQKWENMTYIMRYSEQHLYRLHGSAIKELEKLTEIY